jgi:hypothetical protein
MYLNPVFEHVQLFQSSNDMFSGTLVLVYQL